MTAAWLSLEALANASAEAQESDTIATLPQDLVTEAITLIPERMETTGVVQQSVFLLGQSDGLPRYKRLNTHEFMPARSGQDGEIGSSDWPWWTQTIFGTGVFVTGISVLATASCLIKKAWNYYKYPGGKPDFARKINQQLKKQNQRPRTKSGISAAALPMPDLPFRSGFTPGPGGCGTIRIDPVHLLSIGQHIEPQPYEEAHIYETIDPATGVPQTAQEYEVPVFVQVPVKAESAESIAPESVEIHQKLEQKPDNLDGLPLNVFSEEPWYANTHPGVIVSAPIYTELNKPEAQQTLQHMLAQSPHQVEKMPLGSDHLDNAGPEPSATYFPALIRLEGSPPLSMWGKLAMKAATKGFNLVFRGMEAADSYVYEFPPGHPKRTRAHKLPVSEVLYGEHLTTVDLFDSRIDDMEDPIIGFCNAMGHNVWHAFLVFRNRRTGEYNTLHIRQGSYYPEFMDRAATERYFMYEQKRVVGAISLTRLTELYGARLDCNLLRDIFRQRLGCKEMRYRIYNQNCMTFSMLALWSTNFDWAVFLEKMGLANLQSPYHILKALEGSPKNLPAIHSQENNLLPAWLAELNQ